ncbi:MAG TPA: type II secretion system major pseudopilin GspG [bacterium]
MGDLQRQPARPLAAAARRGLPGLRDERGLTLIELLVVMVILGLFSMIVYQQFFPQVDKAKIQTTRTQMEIMALALDSYRLDVGEYPPALGDLVQSSSPRWKGPYLQKGKVPKDPWGNDYTYQVQEGGNAFTLASTGDGKKEIRYGEEE